MKNLYIVGISYVDFKLIDAINRVEPTWNVKGFIHNPRYKYYKGYLCGYPIVGGTKWISELAKDKDNYFLRAHSHVLLRGRKYAKKLQSNDCQMATLVHPSVDVNRVTIGVGTVLPEGSVVGQNTKIGNNVIVRLNSTISHDVTVEDDVYISPRTIIGGRSVLKKGCFIGMGAVVMNVTVGEGAFVGAGAVVIKDVPPKTVVVGVPAKPIVRNPNP
ncbi:hypothetical protein [Ammoniphilus sp. CFH 90114]|uniref:hypothetical protein n=1 Tax=Ammoniphilus sp. CFH 90114 TaxID=2493665 RepID=UPI00100DA447|nr:hypothetical protein [Ammoniphilus sp. CFH 90114]RXT07181.1 hypothetical protein EIZ39_13640 [Ammoniphilus sp. CFH 90114]